jgi:hypothetical protein
MSQVDADHYLKQAAQVKNVSANGRLIKPAKRYLRFHERQKREEEVKRLDEMLTPSNISATKMGSQSVQMAAKHRANLRQDLEDNAPPKDLPGATVDALVRRSVELENEIIPTLQPREVMRRNPVGAVDNFMKGENSAAVKAKILEWKNLQMLIHPDADEQDIANIEKFRPQTALAGTAATFMAGAQIPGAFAMTPQAKANWPEGMPEFGDVNSPWKQAMERENQELKERLAAMEAKLNKPKPQNKFGPKTSKWTPEQREAARQRGLALSVHRKAKRDEAILAAGRKIGMTEEEMKG